MDTGFELGTDGPMVVVAAVDGSPPSLRAAAYAVGLARRQGTRLVVVHVSVLPVMAVLAPQAAGAVAQARDEVVADLRRQMLGAAVQAGVPVELVVRQGDPFAEIRRACAEVRADAVVVGASAGAGHRFVGSVALRLVRAARWPVTVVP